MQLNDYNLLLKDLIRLPFVETIWLFGSRARGDNLPRSDIDLAILCPTASNNEWLKILDIIEDLEILLKIDCHRLDELSDSSPVKDSIIREGIKIYDKSKNYT